MLERAAQETGSARRLCTRNIPPAGEHAAGFYPPLRTLRRALLIRELGHLTRASESLERSQSVVTRSLLELERFVGCQLFERRPRGMITTRGGNAFFERVGAAFDRLGAAERMLRLRFPTLSVQGTKRLLALDVANARVLALLAVFDDHDLDRAAARLGMASKSIRKSIRAVEQQLGARLFRQTARGVLAPTDLGRVLAVCLKRALAEIRVGLDELRSLSGSISGEVRVGAMATAHSVIVPRTVDVFHERHPNVTVSIHAGDESDLELALICGDIDLIVGTLDASIRPAGVLTTALLEDQVEVVTRGGHPLAGTGDLRLENLLALDWILPPRHSAPRVWFSNLLARKALPEPRPFIETDSLEVLRGALVGGDRVALSTRLHCWHEVVDSGTLCVLPIPALVRWRAERPLKLQLRRRADVALSPASEALCGILSDIAAGLGHLQAVA